MNAGLCRPRRVTGWGSFGKSDPVPHRYADLSDRCFKCNRCLSRTEWLWREQRIAVPSFARPQMASAHAELR